VNALKMDFEAFVTEYSRQVNVDTLLTVQDVHRGLQALRMYAYFLVRSISDWSGKMIERKSTWTQKSSSA